MSFYTITLVISRVLCMISATLFIVVLSFIIYQAFRRYYDDEIKKTKETQDDKENNLFVVDYFFESQAEVLMNPSLTPGLTVLIDQGQDDVQTGIYLVQKELSATSEMQLLKINLPEPNQRFLIKRGKFSNHIHTTKYHFPSTSQTSEQSFVEFNLHSTTPFDLKLHPNCSNYNVVFTSRKEETEVVQEEENSLFLVEKEDKEDSEKNTMVHLFISFEAGSKMLEKLKHLCKIEIGCLLSELHSSFLPTFLALHQHESTTACHLVNCTPTKSAFPNTETCCYFFR